MNLQTIKDTNQRELVKEKIHCVLWLKEKDSSSYDWFESDIEGTYAYCLRQGQDLTKYFNYDIREA